jgi:hypothetical protein
LAFGLKTKNLKIFEKIYEFRQARLTMPSEMNVGSVVNPDPQSFWLAGLGSALVMRILIQEDKMTHKSEEISSLKCWLFSFEG